MNCLISDTFTGILAKLTAQEQQAVKPSVFGIQVKSALPEPANDLIYKVMMLITA